MGWNATSEPTNLTSTNFTNFLIPKGKLIPKADYATLKIIVNITSTFDETRQVCHISDVIEEFIHQRVKNKFSAPNIKVINVFRQNIKGLCD